MSLKIWSGFEPPQKTKCRWLSLISNRDSLRDRGTFYPALECSLCPRRPFCPWFFEITLNSCLSPMSLNGTLNILVRKFGVSHPFGFDSSFLCNVSRIWTAIFWPWDFLVLGVIFISLIFSELHLKIPTELWSVSTLMIRNFVLDFSMCLTSFPVNFWPSKFCQDVFVQKFQNAVELGNIRHALVGRFECMTNFFLNEWQWKRRRQVYVFGTTSCRFQKKISVFVSFL